MLEEQGQIQIHTENIFPIIKKAVYSGHEVFLRELVSNGVDAISKRRMAAMAGDCSEGDDGAIRITVDREAKTITISDKPRRVFSPYFTSVRPSEEGLPMRGKKRL